MVVPAPGGRRACAVLAAVALAMALAVPALASESSPPAGVAPSLAAIPVEAVGAGAAAPAGGPLRLRLQVDDAAGLAQLLGLQPAKAGASPAKPAALEVVVLPGAHADVPSPPDARAATFLVDHDEPAVAGLAEQLRSVRPGQPVDAQAVVAFVARVMQGSLSANASFASEVARTLRGDCTEYALLTAALARRHGIPARIVHGVALLHADGRWQAYGHAWVQTWEAGGWTLRDSALANAPGPVYYLPTMALVEEGPGFLLGMAQGIRRLPSRVEVLGAAPAS